MLTERVMRKRWRRVIGRVFVFGTETREEAEAKQTRKPGHYRKYNGSCGCGLCKPDERRGRRNRDDDEEL